jgi:hypothetical protein
MKVSAEVVVSVDTLSERLFLLSVAWSNAVVGGHRFLEVHFKTSLSFQAWFRDAGGC